MEMIVLDPELQAKIIRHRHDCRGDRYDEVWDGDYVVAPITDNEHAELVTLLGCSLMDALPDPDVDAALMGANVSDRADDWEQNYRCPDGVVVLAGGRAKDRFTHYQGGPDFVVEVICRHDRSRQKFDFYAKVGTRELLIVDRYPWALELYRLNEAGTFDLVGRSTVERPDALASQVMPLAFRLLMGDERPTIAMAHDDGVQAWSA